MDFYFSLLFTDIIIIGDYVKSKGVDFSTTLIHTIQLVELTLKFPLASVVLLLMVLLDIKADVDSQSTNLFRKYTWKH